MLKRHATIFEDDGHTIFTIGDGKNTFGGSEPWPDGINGPDRRVAEHKILNLCEVWEVDSIEIHTAADGVNGRKMRCYTATVDDQGNRRWSGKITAKDKGWYSEKYETFADMLFATRHDTPINAGEEESPESGDGWKLIKAEDQEVK